MRPVVVVFAGFAMTLLLASAVAAAVVAVAGVALVSQKGRAFSTGSVEIKRGEVVRFTNDDKFLHQIYVDLASFNYDSEEQDPGTSADIHFPKPGSFNVRCHIHPKMLVTIEVR